MSVSQGAVAEAATLLHTRVAIQAQGSVLAFNHHVHVAILIGTSPAAGVCNLSVSVHCSFQNLEAPWQIIPCRDLFPRGPPLTAQQAPLG